MVTERQSRKEEGRKGRKETGGDEKDNAAFLLLTAEDKGMSGKSRKLLQLEMIDVHC